MKKVLLTKQDILNVNKNLQHMVLTRCCGKEITSRIITEMIEYKTIEEKLETDIATYFKYVGSEKAFVKEYDGTIQEYYVIGGTLYSIILMPMAFPYGECEIKRQFKDYGKTWALTREELE